MIDLTRYNILFDCYSSLLTPRQREIFSMHYQFDLSLGEIANNVGVSRQAVHDLLKRTLRQLDYYEANLALAAKDKQTNRLLDEIEAGLEQDLPRERLLALVSALRSI